MTLLAIAALVSPATGARAISPEELKKIEAAVPAKATAKPSAPRKLLVFSRGKGNVHTAIPYGAKALELMGKKTGAFEAVHSVDPAVFKPDSLKRFDAICFNNSNRMDFFKDPALAKSVIDFVKGGKGVVGIHSATTNFSARWALEWPEGAEMLGGIFNGHPWHEKVTIKVDEPDHPLNAAFKGEPFEITDEIYQFTGPYSRKKLRVLLSLDLTRTKVTAGHRKRMKRTDNDYAVSWVRKFGAGRVFYCSLGHEHSVFWNPAVLKHYLDGIQFALGDLRADATPSAAAAGPATKPAAPRKLGWRKTSDSLALLNNGRAVWRLNYGKDCRKPYFHPVALVDGTVLTWLSPPDHPWHRAMWFSWKYINRMNYWEEDRKTGLSQGRTEVLAVKVARGKDHSARIKMSLSYQKPGRPVALTEKRLLTVSAPDEAGRYRIDWRLTFTAGARNVLLDRTPPPGKLGGRSYGGYAGLSVRLAEKLTGFALLSSEGKRDQKAHGQAARWMDFSALTPDGRPAGIALG